MANSEWRIAGLCAGLFALAGVAFAQTSVVTVPFVGCASDGQAGPEPAPEGKPVAVKLDAKAAARLAFYQSKYDNGVLAPRGWHCANLEGSNGWMLFVSPRPIKPDDFFPENVRTVSGPFIEVWFSPAGTSGKFQAARILSRYFPEQSAFVHGANAAENEFNPKPGPYPSGPYPKDRLVSHRKGVVEYITPPHTRGLGTSGRLKPDAGEVFSAAMLMPDANKPNVLTVAVRLPKESADLAPAIIHDTEERYGGVN